MNALGGPELNDRQIARMAFRVRLFRHRGLSEHAAEQLADRLAWRDYDHDDRRLCIECAHRANDRTCTAIRVGRYPLGTDDSLLQRCPSFNFQTP